MNPADKTKIENALAIVDNLQGQLGNIDKRGPLALKLLAGEVANQATAEGKAKLKGQVLVPLAKLLKDAKAVRKDLEALYKEGTEPKKLAAYADGKAFRAKAQAKHLGSTKAFEATGLAMVNSLRTVLDADGVNYPGMNSVEVKVTVDSIASFSKYYNALRIELAKL